MSYLTDHYPRHVDAAPTGSATRGKIATGKSVVDGSQFYKPNGAEISATGGLSNTLGAVNIYTGWWWFNSSFNIVEAINACPQHHGANASGFLSTVNVAVNAKILASGYNATSLSIRGLSKDRGQPGGKHNVSTYPPSTVRANRKIKATHYNNLSAVLTSVATFLGMSTAGTVAADDPIYASYTNELHTLFTLLTKQCLCNGDCNCNINCTCNANCGCNYWLIY